MPKGWIYIFAEVGREEDCKIGVAKDRGTKNGVIERLASEGCCTPLGLRGVACWPFENYEEAKEFENRVKGRSDPLLWKGSPLTSVDPSGGAEWYKIPVNEAVAVISAELGQPLKPPHATPKEAMNLGTVGDTFKARLWVYKEKSHRGYLKLTCHAYWFKWRGCYKTANPYAVLPEATFEVPSNGGGPYGKENARILEVCRKVIAQHGGHSLGWCYATPDAIKAAILREGLLEIPLNSDPIGYNPK